MSRKTIRHQIWACFPSQDTQRTPPYANSSRSHSVVVVNVVTSRSCLRSTKSKLSTTVTCKESNSDAVLIWTCIKERNVLTRSMVCLIQRINKHRQSTSPSVNGTSTNLIELSFLYIIVPKRTPLPARYAREHRPKLIMWKTKRSSPAETTSTSRRLYCRGPT